MVKKYFLSQSAILFLASLIIIISNVVGYGANLWDSVLGVFVLSLIGLAGLTFNKFLSRWVKLPSLLFVALFGLILGSPLNPFSAKLAEICFKVNFMAPPRRSVASPASRSARTSRSSPSRAGSTSSSPSL